jgi:hypothetical protein
LWFVLRVARHETRLNPDEREFKSVRWFGLDEPQDEPQDEPRDELRDELRDWPTDTYDPEMYRFAAKLRSALGPRQG